jgi:hypothetical protein
MVRIWISAVLLGLLFLGPARAADTPLALATAQGIIDKVEKDSLTVHTRGPDGKFGKSVVLKVTGTSKITTVTPQTRGGKLVLVQKDTDVKDLQPKQSVVVIYATAGDDTVLLAAVVQPAAP